MPVTEPPALKVRNRPGVYWFADSAQLVYLAFGIFIVVASLTAKQTHGSSGYRIYGLIVGAVVIAVATVRITETIRGLRPIRVTSSQVRIVRGLRTTRLERADISGVGLLFRYRDTRGRGPLNGWYLTIWDGTGTQHQISEILINAGNWKLDPTVDGPLPAEDATTLARSNPGELASQLHAYVIEQQGETGKLATRQMQKHPVNDRWDTVKTLAFWSPDGTMSRVH